MSRKKPNVELSFFGVHRSEWYRLMSDYVELVSDVYKAVPCTSCDVAAWDSEDSLRICEPCVLSRVRLLASARLDHLDKIDEFEKKYPKLFGDSEINR